MFDNVLSTLYSGSVAFMTVAFYIIFLSKIKDDLKIKSKIGFFLAGMFIGAALISVIFVLGLLVKEYL